MKALKSSRRLFNEFDYHSSAVSGLYYLMLLLVVFFFCCLMTLCLEKNKQPVARDGNNLSNHETDDFDFGFRFDRSSWSDSVDDGDTTKSVEADQAALILDFSLASSSSVCVVVVVGRDKTLASRGSLLELEPMFPLGSRLILPEKTRVWSADETNGRD